jgi:hypothetical protein
MTQSYAATSDDTKSEKLEIADAFGEFPTEVMDKYSGINDNNASHDFFFHFLLSDGQLYAKAFAQTDANGKQNRRSVSTFTTITCQ